MNHHLRHRMRSCAARCDLFMMLDSCGHKSRCSMSCHNSHKWMLAIKQMALYWFANGRDMPRSHEKAFLVLMSYSINMSEI